MVMQVDIFHFELFDSVAQTQSLTRTAELFNITQPAVSHNLKKLEDSYGVKLFERTSRGIVLTAAGRELLPFVRNILAVMSDARTRMLNIAAGRVGHIRIASIPALLNYVAQSVKIMHEKMPSVQIDVDLYEGPEMVGYMALNSYDFFFSTDAQLESLSEYGHALIAKDSLDLFVSEDMKSIINTDDLTASLSEIPFVSVPMSDQQLATPVFNILNLYQVESNFVNFYNRVESVLLAVSVGIGISILPRALKDSYQCKNIATFPVRGGEDALEYYFSWNFKNNVNPANSLFTETVLELYDAKPL